MFWFKKKRLRDLADDERTYWKFTQSKPGLSYESNVFALYEEGKLTHSLDKDKLLSFVSDQTIYRCYMYGDQLTKLCFDKNNPLFQEIQKLPYINKGGGLGEYETSCLLVEKIYSLREKETIRLLFSTIPSRIGNINTNWLVKFEKNLRKFGFDESAELINQIADICIESHERITKEDVLTFIDMYKDF